MDISPSLVTGAASLRGADASPQPSQHGWVGGHRTSLEKYLPGAWDLLPHMREAVDFSSDSRK